jgi:hypothetical protein
MGSLQAVVSYRSSRGQPDVCDRSPALQFVMAVMVEQVGNRNRGARARRFNRCERRMIIHNLVGQQNLLPPAPPEVQRRKIIKRARCSDSCEEPVVFFIPKAVLFFWLRVQLLSRKARSGSDWRVWLCGARRLSKAQRTDAQKSAPGQNQQLKHALAAHPSHRPILLMADSQWSIITMLPSHTRRYKGILQ